MSAGPKAANAERPAAVFGKLPAHGDFVGRGFAATDRERIDGWLSDCMTQAYSDFAADFAAAFDAAVPWRCEGPSLSGAIAPSRDSTGRRFPILVLIRETAQAQVCEDLLYNAIAEGWTAGRLHREAGGGTGDGIDGRTGAANGGWTVGHWPQRWWVMNDEGDTRETLAQAYPSGLLSQMLTVAGVGA